MGKISVFFCLLLRAFSSAHLISTGSYFKIMLEMMANKGAPAQPIAVQAFLHCDASSSCSYIGQKGEITQHILAQKNTEASKKKFEIWKKLKSQFKDCQEIYDYGIKWNGEYVITPKKGMNLKVYCDMESGGGGWTVIQRRVDDKIDFQRNWHDYKYGFGELNGNLWIGLENMHILAGTHEGAILRIKMKHWQNRNITYYANYCKFTISDERDYYRVNMNGYWGTAGDPFLSGVIRHNGMRFSTKGVDNDKLAHFDCALSYNGGWWYSHCHSCQLNSLYPKSGHGGGPTYMSWDPMGFGYGNIYYSEMEITRESNFSPIQCVA